MNPILTEQSRGKIERAAFVAYAASLPFSISAAQISLGVLLLCLLGRRLFGKSRGFCLMDAALIAYLAWIVIASIASLDPARSLSRLPKLWVHLAWFALTGAAVRRSTLRVALWAFLVSAGLMGLYGLAQHLFGPAVPRFLVPQVELWQPTGGYFHAVGLFDHHLTYGNTMILCFALGLGFLLALPGRGRWVVAGLLLAILSGIAFSYARGAWLSLVVILAAFGVLIAATGMTSTTGTKRRRTILALTVGAALLFAPALISPTLRDRVGTIFKISKNRERLYLWKSSLDMAVDHPVTGIGPGLYRKVVDDYRRDYDFRWTTSSHAHNSFLMAAAEGGFVALALFLALLAAALYQALAGLRGLARGSPDHFLLAAFAAAQIGFAFSCLFQHNFGDAEVVMTFWFVVAMAALWRRKPVDEEI